MHSSADTMDGPSSATKTGLSVAIIGAGVAGLTLALGLSVRGIEYTIYERAHGFNAIGAGIGFSDNAEKAMKALDSRIHGAFNRVRKQNGLDWFKWMDANPTRDADEDPTVADRLITQLYLGERGFEGCTRAEFLLELSQSLPDGAVNFNHALDTVVDLGPERPLRLSFTNGTSVDADIVVGCDGLRSRVRQLILGESNPASYPSYTHKYAFRGLIPMQRAVSVLGERKANTRHMYVGRNGNALTFPVAGGQFLNVVAFTTDTDDWPTPEKLTMPTTREAAAKAFAGLNATVRAIIDLLPAELDKWAIYDTFDRPASTFWKGRMCIIGDAAHAAAPYHGAGAGFAIEDGLVLAEVLSLAQERWRVSKDRSWIIPAALSVYDSVRRERALWLVESSRFVGNMYQWQVEEVGEDYYKRCAEEVEWRCRKIWYYDIDLMIEKARDEFGKRIQS